MQRQRPAEDETDWRAWLRRHGPGLVLYARQLVGVEHADDAVQEAFMRYWTKRDRVSEPRAYVAAAVRTVCLDLRRAAGREAARVARSAAGGAWFVPGVDGAAMDGERAARVQAALGALPEAQREVVVLKLWNGLTFAQVGEAVGVSMHTAASRYRLALRALRPALEGVA